MTTAHTATPKLVISIAPAPLKECLSDGYEQKSIDLLRKANIAVAAHDDLVKALEKAVPLLRQEFLQLAEKYAGTAFESDATYQGIKARYENAVAALAKAGTA